VDAPHCLFRTRPTLYEIWRAHSRLVLLYIEEAIACLQHLLLERSRCFVVNRGRGRCGVIPLFRTGTSSNFDQPKPRTPGSTEALANNKDNKAPSGWKGGQYVRLHTPACFLDGILSYMYTRAVRSTVALVCIAISCWCFSAVDGLYLWLAMLKRPCLDQQPWSPLPDTSRGARSTGGILSPANRCCNAARPRSRAEMGKSPSHSSCDGTVTIVMMLLTFP
jgi:hypothetical protein